MTVRLVEQHGERAGLSHPLDPAGITIGRSEGNTIRVEGAQISRNHARVVQRGSQFFIVDESRNGTWLNTRRLEPNELQPLRTGDCISLPGVDLELIYSELPAEHETEPVIAHPGDGIYVHPATGRLWRDGRELDLTPREQECFELLYRNRGTWVTRRQIMDHVWGYEVGKNDLDELIYLLRRKLEPAPGTPRYLMTLRGRGYRLNV